MVGAVWSAIMSKRLKMKKSLAMHYWQDIPSLMSSSRIMLQISINFEEFR